MPWTGTTIQHQALWQALDQALDAQGFPAQRLAAMINDDKRALETIRQASDKARSVIDDGTLKRWHRSLKDRILLENYYLPGDLENKIEEFVNHYNARRYHESLNNLTPEDVWLGRGERILQQRRKIKEKTMKLRKQLHQQKIAA